MDITLRLVYRVKNSSSLPPQHPEAEALYIEKIDVGEQGECVVCYGRDS